MTHDGVTYSLHYDQVGSLRVVADATGNVIKEVSYTSFGNILNDSNPAFKVPIGFAGGLHDRDTGFVRFGFRDYDPETGRFTALDPIGAAGGDNDWYGYCLDDPVNAIDPLGLEGQECDSGVFLCRRPADIAAGMLDHHWIKTMNTEAGMGREGGEVPDHGSDWPYATETEIVDHSGQSQWPQSSCECIPQVNATCVDQELSIGRPTGTWTFGNHCQSFADDILERCGKNDYDIPGAP